jgi:hypothetical protein
MQANDVPAIRGMLQELVPGYKPTGAVVDWVSVAQSKLVERV